MKIKCPVAGCDYIIKGADDGFKHWQKYDEKHKQLHRNWLNYFYTDLANSDWSDEVKYRFAYKKWRENEKKQKVQAQKQKNNDNVFHSANVEMGSSIDLYTNFPFYFYGRIKHHRRKPVSREPDQFAVGITCRHYGRVSIV